MAHCGVGTEVGWYGTKDASSVTVRLMTEAAAQARRSKTRSRPVADIRLSKGEAVKRTSSERAKTHARVNISI